MDHDAICDCPFRAGCVVFEDRLVDPGRKGPQGFGCYGRNDQHRREHCKTFRCKYMLMVLAELVGAPSAREPKGPQAGGDPTSP